MTHARIAWDAPTIEREVVRDRNEYVQTLLRDDRTSCKGDPNERSDYRRNEMCRVTHLLFVDETDGHISRSRCRSYGYALSGGSMASVLGS